MEHSLPESPLRIALYSHDAQGLGHVRRNLAIAAALHWMRPTPDILVLTGAAEAARLPRPPGCDVVTLPAMAKDDDGGYGPRHLSMHTMELVRIRSAILAGAIASFGPDLLVVDRHPRGFRGELEPALGRLTSATKVVLGLRDVLDEPSRARAEWLRDGGDLALRKWYHQVWLYGDPAVYDLAADIDLASDEVPVVHTGYLARGRADANGRTSDDGRADANGRTGDDVRSAASRRPYVLGLVGGGGDGAPLARAFASAAMPPGHDGVLVTGPQMPRDEVAALRRLARDRSGLRVVRFTDEIETLLRHAAAFVTMGGYNTICEVITRGRPALVYPRVRPRQEQLVRAERLAALGLVDLLRPDQLSAAAISAWLGTAVGRAPEHGNNDDGRGVEPGVGPDSNDDGYDDGREARQWQPLRLDGLAQLPRLARALTEVQPVGGAAHAD